MHLKGRAQSEAKSVAFSVALSAGLAVRRCLVLEVEPLTSRPLPNQLRIPAREPEGRGDVLTVIKACIQPNPQAKVVQTDADVSPLLCCSDVADVLLALRLFFCAGPNICLLPN